MVATIRVTGTLLVLGGLYLLTRLLFVLDRLGQPGLSADQRMIALVFVGFSLIVGLSLTATGLLTLLRRTRRVAKLAVGTGVFVIWFFGQIPLALLASGPPPMTADGNLREGPLLPGEMRWAIFQLVWLAVVAVLALASVRWVGRQPDSAFERS